MFPVFTGTLVGCLEVNAHLYCAPGLVDESNLEGQRSLQSRTQSGGSFMPSCYFHNSFKTVQCKTGLFWGENNSCKIH